MRKEWIDAVKGTISNYRNAAENPGEKYDHIASEKLQKIIDECEKLEKWLLETSKKQDAMEDHETPILMCTDMEKKNTELASMADEVLKERKPAPPVEEKKRREGGGSKG